MLVAITAGIITVKPNSLLVPLHSPFRFSRIMLIPIMHRRNSATYLETASMYWRIVPPQIYPSVGIAPGIHQNIALRQALFLLGAFWYSNLCILKPRKRPLIDRQQPVIGQVAPSVLPPLPAPVYAPFTIHSLAFCCSCTIS